MKRRTFLKITLGSTMGLTLCPHPLARAVPAEEPLFKISLAEWSLHQTLRAGKMTNLDFPKVAKRDFGIDCIEFVDQFFADKSRDQAYLKELKSRAEGEGVAMGLIMLDTNGALGAAKSEERKEAVDKTRAWIDAARFLGCHTVRVNARGPNQAGELRRAVAESCATLADYAKDINIVIENHGGLSSDPQWLASVMTEVNKPNFGTLPDFGNFPDDIDRYDAVERLMPFAKAVSAKASSFTPEGLVKETDFFRMMRLVRDGGYHGHVGVESGAPKQEGEAAAIRMTHDLLKRIRDEQSRCKPIFNGRDLDGWTALAGGEWEVNGTVLTGRNGKDWSTNPEKTGSWLSTTRQYSDFRLELQYTINRGGNSGVFFRSSHEKNPAFTGYEMQIFDAPGAAPTNHGPGSIYDVAAPSKNLTRPAGQWNTVTLVAKGPKITIDMNGERTLEATLGRSMTGYIGLQCHDAKSVVQFKNIRVETL